VTGKLYYIHTGSMQMSFDSICEY